VSGAEGPPASSLLLYQTEDGRARVECRFADDTLWLTRAQMADLFQTSEPNVNIHLHAIDAERALVSEATIKSYLIVRPETDAPRQLEAAAKKLPKRRKAQPAGGGKA
jgi:hypothetical protein